MTGMFARIRWRLVAWTMLVVGLILAFLGSAIYVALSRTLLAEVDRNLASRAEQAAENFGAVISGDHDADREGYRGGVFYLIVSAGGQVLANPQQVDMSGLQLPQLAGRRSAYATQRVADEPVRLFARPLGEHGRSTAFLIVGQSLAPEQEALASLVLILIAGGGAGLVLTFAGAWFLAGRALVPIQLAFRRQQEFVADASHELRTPLTVLRTATDLLNQHREEPLSENGQLFDDVRHEVARMERLSADLLTLARSDRGELHLEVAAVDVAALASDLVRRTAPLAQAQEISLEYRHAAPPAHSTAVVGPVVEADPDRLEQVFLILIDNALQHTPAGGRVTVNVDQGEGHVAVTVADTGSGIAPEQLPRIFERFYRADPSRSAGRGAGGGAGLGLAIAKTLVEAHGGTLTLASATGAGTRATVRLRRETAPEARKDVRGTLAAHVR